MLLSGHRLLRSVRQASTMVHIHAQPSVQAMAILQHGRDWHFGWHCPYAHGSLIRPRRNAYMSACIVSGAFPSARLLTAKRKLRPLSRTELVEQRNVYI